MTQDLDKPMVDCHARRAKASKTVKIGSRRLRRFLPPEEAVDDGTSRCIFCGQIDEPSWHKAEFCFEAPLRAHREGEGR